MRDGHHSIACDGAVSGWRRLKRKLGRHRSVALSRSDFVEIEGAEVEGVGIFAEAPAGAVGPVLIGERVDPEPLLFGEIGRPVENGENSGDHPQPKKCRQEESCASIEDAADFSGSPPSDVRRVVVPVRRSAAMIGRHAHEIGGSHAQTGLAQARRTASLASAMAKAALSRNPASAIATTAT